MELAGICSVCGMAGKMYTCPFCGRNVCMKCFNFERGICIQCASRARSGSDITFG
ncbi:MAG: orotate phosphoribosyltransferase [Methanomethylovorans sp.]|jgi:hypothetical protein|nr:orotate phosphoribosyltransferase [Methanomethylovorans sp.]